MISWRYSCASCLARSLITLVLTIGRKLKPPEWKRRKTTKNQKRERERERERERAVEAYQTNLTLVDTWSWRQHGRLGRWNEVNGAENSSAQGEWVPSPHPSHFGRDIQTLFSSFPTGGNERKRSLAGEARKRRICEWFVANLYHILSFDFEIDESRTER